MKQIDTLIGRLLKYGTLLSTYGLVTTVLIQIFARFFLDQAPSWTEEAARLFFIYAISFASGLALKNQYYVHLDLVYNKLSSRGKKILDFGIQVLTLMLFGIMAVYAIPFIVLGWAETSPSMGLRMAFAFLSMFIMAISLCYYAGIAAKKALNNLRS